MKTIKIETIFLVCAKSTKETFDYGVWAVCKGKVNANILCSYYRAKYTDMIFYVNERTLDDWYAVKLREEAKKAGD